LDGVDIDYVYHYDRPQALKFLKNVMQGLRKKLPTKLVIMSPEDSVVVPSSPFYNTLKEIAPSLDFLMVHHYNGITRPVKHGVKGTMPKE